ncbi:hypothetical protein BJF93_06065 [Xaviernesmea oryzae]|uniref:Flagellar hook-basal body complex protein FliE n=1 Tax=Xaviernesmea oryzae TaxID=464029 RepID=A0A1Q9AS03_9HYPH|nr:flagellar hook-basal body complex protein FliE [Xaviernesmea oryzae]OLP58190.1 hypothetical protein BJF93_06065 [Xaviernesmea oryzae]SEL47309.1 flagellar hook-basal body complex protein FliE [Xaviernesmea oryzae]
MINSIHSISSAISGAGELGSLSSSGSTTASGLAGGLMGTATPGTPNAPSFSAVMADMATDTIGSLRNAESLSLAGVQGKADSRQVVDAVMNADQTLQTAVAIRDKVVTAYLEIARMAI